MNEKKGAPFTIPDEPVDGCTVEWWQVSQIGLSIAHHRAAYHGSTPWSAYSPGSPGGKDIVEQWMLSERSDSDDEHRVTGRTAPGWRSIFSGEWDGSYGTRAEAVADVVERLRSRAAGRREQLEEDERRIIALGGDLGSRPVVPWMTATQLATRLGFGVIAIGRRDDQVLATVEAALRADDPRAALAVWREALFKDDASAEEAWAAAPEAPPAHEYGPAEPLIVCTPGVLGGAARIAGTRISVATLVGCRAGGWNDAKILEQYPTLRQEQLDAAWALVAEHSEVAEDPNEEGA